MKGPCSFIFPLLLVTAFGYAQSPELPVIQRSLPHITDSARYVDALNRIAMLLYEKNADSTFYYTRDARDMAIRMRYEKGKADAQNNLGIFFDIKGNLQLALRYYNEAYTGYRGMQDSSNCVQSLMNIAMVYKEMGKDDRAVQWFDGALALGKDLRHDSIMSLAIYNYLLLYPDRFNRDSTRYYIEQARQIATRYNDTRTLIAIDQLVADDMIAHGKREEGLALLQKTIDSVLDKHLYYVSMDILIDMGEQLAETDSARAVAYFRQGLDIAGKNGYFIYSQMLTRKLFDFYIARGDNAHAAVYSRQLIALSDEADNINNLSSIDYIDFALKEEQVKSLQLRSKYQVTLIVLALLACLLAVVIMLMVRRNLKRTRKLNEQVSSQNDQMKKALTALEQSQADNTRMMKMVAHDLRNPVGAMYSIASIMLEEPNRSEDDRMMLGLIQTSSKNSLDMVGDLLQVQFQAEKLHKEPLDMAEMLEYCVSLSVDKAVAKGQHIELQAEPATLSGSREKLWRVISNLISNAVKFSPKGARVDVQMEKRGEEVHITVKDEGIGIPAELQEKVFDLFTEAKRPGTAGEQAFGLGLAISKQIVEAHGGRIWFESRQGKGTTFFVELPVN